MVTTVRPPKDEYHGHTEIELTFEDTNEKVEVHSEEPRFKGLALMRDIDQARAMFLGRTLWLKKTNTLRTYNDDTGDVGGIYPKPYSRVVVIDIVAGWDTRLPVRIVVKTSSEKKVFLIFQ